MWDLILNNLGTITGFILGIAAIGFVAAKASNVLTQISELLNAIVVALADKKLTKEEVNTIIKEAKDIPLAIKDLFKK